MKLPLVFGLASMVTLMLSPTDALSQIQPLWSLRANAGPSPRTGQCMSYDSSRGVTVLFGGWSGSMALGDTWEWNGRTWNLRNVPGPSPRAGAMMAFDSIRHVTLLFGGVAGTTNYDDTWEWNGATWTLRVGSGVSRPPGRSSGAMVFDSARNAFVLFGGTNGGNLGDTWEFNGTWTLRATTGPSARHAVAMAFDSTRHETVLFGSSLVTNDTWVWNGITWTQRMVTGPRARGAAAMSFDSVRHVSVLFGGDGNTIGTDPLGDTWEWSGTTWSLRANTGPSRRFGHSMVYDSFRGVTLLFGGYNGSPPTYGDTWGFYCVADMDDGSGTGTPDGGVTIDDLLYYLLLFEAGSIRADVDDGSGTGTPDGGVTIDDLLYYLFRFEQGC